MLSLRTICSDPHRLRLETVIGQGSFGVVHRACWRGSLVAAKVISLSPNDVGAVMREIEILKSVNV